MKECGYGWRVSKVWNIKLNRTEGPKVYPKFNQPQVFVKATAIDINESTDALRKWLLKEIVALTETFCGVTKTLLRLFVGTP